MGFTRSFLKSIGLTEEQINATMEEHVTVTDGLKKQRDDYKADAEKYKADADKLPEIQKQLDDMKGGEDYKAKYDKEHGEFEAYKLKIAQEAEAEKVKSAFRSLLRDEKIGDKYLDSVIRATDFSGVKLDKEGKLEDADGLKKKIGELWGDFKVTTRERGAKVDNPPKQNGGDNGANPRAAEIARQFHERRYGIAPKNDGAKDSE